MQKVHVLCGRESPKSQGLYSWLFLTKHLQKGCREAIANLQKEDWLLATIEARILQTSAWDAFLSFGLDTGVGRFAKHSCAPGAQVCGTERADLKVMENRYCN